MFNKDGKANCFGDCTCLGLRGRREQNGGELLHNLIVPRDLRQLLRRPYCFHDVTMVRFPAAECTSSLFASPVPRELQM